MKRTMNTQTTRARRAARAALTVWAPALAAMALGGCDGEVGERAVSVQQAATTRAVVPFIDASMKARLRTVYLNGQARGNRAAVFSKVGDTITTNASNLTGLGCGSESLSTHTELAPTISYFRGTTLTGRSSTGCRTVNSFTLTSVAAGSSWTTASVLGSIARSGCAAPYNTALKCELRLTRPSVALIELGTYDLASINNVTTFTNNLTRIVTDTVAAGVIPVLATIPPRLDNATRASRVAAYNDAILAVAAAQQVPVWDYWVAVTQPGMVNQGISTGGILPNVYGTSQAFNFSAAALTYGYNQRNLTALQVLAHVKAVVIDDGAPDSTGADAGTDAASDATDATSDTADAATDTADATGDTADAATDTTDASLDATSDAATDAATDSAMDGGADSGVRVCPVAGNGGSAATCFPGEPRCYCDTWGDCYRQDGYVPCVMPDGGLTADVPTDVTPDTAPSDAGPLAADPVTYTGAFVTRGGYQYASITAAGLARDVHVYAPYSRGPKPPLVVAFHGADLNGTDFVMNSDAQSFAERYGVVVVAADARFQTAGDFNRPAGNSIFWVTANDTNPDTNPDLVLTRALIKESNRAFNADLDHVYAVGFSNGGFMALEASVALRDRIAAFAESSAGIVPCATRPDCAFVGSTYTCGGLAGQAGYCACTGPDKPIPLPTTGARGGFLWHAAEDNSVSVYYSCTLASRLASVGAPSQIVLWSGGHTLRPDFLTSAWPFLAASAR